MCIYFDPSEKIREIQQLLVSDKKKIGFLFGAGTSISQKNDKSPTVPAVITMTNIVVEKLNKEGYTDKINSIKEDITENGEKFNIETLLTNIEGKISIIGKGVLNGLDKKGFETLADRIHELIRESVSIHNSISVSNYENMAQHDFGLWIQGACRKYPVEIFTTNYDYLFEIGLEQNNVPYYDGFTGSYKPFFNPESVEDLRYLPQQTKLWKIHGSLGLHQDSENRIIRNASDRDDLLIYPSSFKYSSSKKQPYTSFMDRLNNFIKQDDAVLFVCGYSFGDEHINERIISALQTDTTAHVYILNYDLSYDSDGNKTNSFNLDCSLAKLAKSCKKLSVFSMKTAIIGTKYGIWKLKRKPDDNDNINIYFQQDELSHQETDNWTGEGQLLLADFAKFTHFLLNMIPNEYMEEKTDER